MEKGWIEYIREMLVIYEQAEASGSELTDEQLGDLENLLEACLSVVQYIKEQREEARQAAACQGREARTEI